MPKRRGKNKKFANRPIKRAGAVAASPVASLQFPPGENCGLTSVALSISSNKAAPTIVREIVQNSLDAATVAKRETAYVEFLLEDILSEDIPGIGEYKKAVSAVAARYEENGWPEQSKDIIQKLQKGAERKTLPALVVSDNGVGLTKKSMAAIMSDGVPEHGREQSTGSHGNGHFTTFNLSDMRYILYGGISEVDGKLAAGHTILASHQGKGCICGKNGYYVVQFTNKQSSPYIFPENDKIPGLILKHLNKIEAGEWKTGTVLVIPYFNYFWEDQESAEHAAEMILGAAAQNFFVAIQRGRLVVSVKNGKKEWKVDSEKVQSAIAKTKKFPRIKDFPNHDTADRFSRLFADCVAKKEKTNIIEVESGQGKFHLYYRTGDISDTKIALCRNGMWITADIPLISRSSFVENVPFEGLLLCDANTSGDLHDYIRKAEGNLHNSLTIKLIQDKNKQKALRAALKKAREHIQKTIEKQNTQSMEFMEIMSDSIAPVPPKRESVKRIPTDAPGDDIDPPGNISTPTGETEDKPKNSTRAKSGKSLGMNFAAAPSGKGKLKIRIVSTELAADVELRLSVNGGGDISCVNAASENTHLEIQNAECGGAPCPVKDGGAFLGKIDKGESKMVEVTYAEPPIKGNYRIDCRFIRRAQAA